MDLQVNNTNADAASDILHNFGLRKCCVRPHTLGFKRARNSKNEKNTGDLYSFNICTLDAKNGLLRKFHWQVQDSNKVSEKCTNDCFEAKSGEAIRLHISIFDATVFSLEEHY